MVRVWDAPQRVIHWLLAGSVLTAWFSANVSDNLHIYSGYAALALGVLRIVWGFVGGRHARFASFVRPWRAVVRYVRQLGQGEPGRYLGLNPAMATFAVLILALVIVSTISGMMQTTVRFFGVDWVETLHTWSSNLILGLAIAHALFVLVLCAMQRENLIKAMFTGRKRAR